jgi:hypothetical protein
MKLLGLICEGSREILVEASHEKPSRRFIEGSAPPKLGAGQGGFMHEKNIMSDR